jgi:hypothetical protein
MFMLLANLMSFGSFVFAFGYTVTVRTETASRFAANGAVFVLRTNSFARAATVFAVCILRGGQYYTAPFEETLLCELEFNE